MFNIDQSKRKLKFSILNVLGLHTTMTKMEEFSQIYILCENISKCFLLDFVQYLANSFFFCSCQCYALVRQFIKHSKHKNTKTSMEDL